MNEDFESLIDVDASFDWKQGFRAGWYARELRVTTAVGLDDLSRVADAIRRCKHRALDEHPWNELPKTMQNWWIAHAQAAIDAIGLTEDGVADEEED